MTIVVFQHILLSVLLTLRRNLGLNNINYCTVCANQLLSARVLIPELSLCMLGFRRQCLIILDFFNWLLPCLGVRGTDRQGITERFLLRPERVGIARIETQILGEALRSHAECFASHLRELINHFLSIDSLSQRLRVFLASDQRLPVLEGWNQG